MIPQEDYQGFTKDEIMKTLLRICPPDSSSMKGSQQDPVSRDEDRIINILIPGL